MSRDHADREAKRQYRLFDERRRAAEKARVDQEYARLRQQAEALPKGGRARRPKV